jgi:hypothetical protein
VILGGSALSEDGGVAGLTVPHSLQRRVPPALAGVPQSWYPHAKQRPCLSQHRRRRCLSNRGMARIGSTANATMAAQIGSTTACSSLYDAPHAGFISLCARKPKPKPKLVNDEFCRAGYASFAFPYRYHTIRDLRSALRSRRSRSTRGCVPCTYSRLTKMPPPPTSRCTIDWSWYASASVIAQKPTPSRLRISETQRYPKRPSATAHTAVAYDSRRPFQSNAGSHGSKSANGTRQNQLALACHVCVKSEAMIHQHDSGSSDQVYLKFVALSRANVF